MRTTVKERLAELWGRWREGGAGADISQCGFPRITPYGTQLQSITEEGCRSRYMVGYKVRKGDNVARVGVGLLLNLKIKKMDSFVDMVDVDVVFRPTKCYTH